MNTIAEQSGVSRSTVSLVLNGRTEGIRIPDETRNRVLEVAAELGYRRNELARAVVTGKNRVFGFITTSPHLDAEYKALVLSGAVEAATEIGYAIKVIYLPEHRVQRDVIERCVEWRLAGVMALAVADDVIDHLRAEMGRHQIQVAMLGDLHLDPEVLCIATDVEGGLKASLEHLKNLGHRHIAYIAPDAHDLSGQRREKSLRELCEQLDLKLVFAYGDWWQRDANEAAARQILALNPRPTAVLCSGDPAALVLVAMARAAGLQVPRDISVVGYGDYVFANFCDPPLTTVSQPFRQVGRTAIEHLFRGTSSAKPSRSHFFLPTQLVVRGTTALAPR